MSHVMCQDTWTSPEMQDWWPMLIESGGRGGAISFPLVTAKQKVKVAISIRIFTISCSCQFLYVPEVLAACCRFECSDRLTKTSLSCDKYCKPCWTYVHRTSSPVISKLADLNWHFISRNPWSKRPYVSSYYNNHYNNWRRPFYWITVDLPSTMILFLNTKIEKYSGSSILTRLDRVCPQFFCQDFVEPNCRRLLSGVATFHWQDKVRDLGQQISHRLGMICTWHVRIVIAAELLAFVDDVLLMHLAASEFASRFCCCQRLRVLGVAVLRKVEGFFKHHHLHNLLARDRKIVLCC